MIIIDDDGVRITDKIHSKAVLSGRHIMKTGHSMAYTDVEMP